MKLVMTLAMVLGVSAGAMAAEKTTTTTTTTAAPTLNMSATTTPKMAQNTLAFNFIGLSQGKTNIYFDVGGISERVSPALSFRSYSNKEKRKKLQDAEVTVDRSLATIGASIAAVKADNKALIVNPYLYFGTEKDSINTSNNSGIGLRVVGQLNINKGMGLQAGIDANNMEETFKSDIYVGVAFAL
jgi:hypothetical protein